MKHLTVDEIFSEIKKTYPKIGRSTIYRNVEEMVYSGKLKKLSGAGPKAIYEANIGNHAHIVCKDTGKIIDLELKDINIKNIPDGFNVENIDIKIFGSYS